MRAVTLVAAALVYASAPVPGKAAPPTWTADPRTGCRVADPEPDPDWSITWSGACQNGLAQGEGILTWFNRGKPGSTYQGSYRDGKMNGHGIYTWSDGVRYDGEWRDDQKDGQGVLTWPSGSRYEGQWRNGKRNGFGVATWPDGARYEGQWRNDWANGPGKYRGHQGDIYEGTWIDGCFKNGRDKASVGRAVETCR